MTVKNDQEKELNEDIEQESSTDETVNTTDAQPEQSPLQEDPPAASEDDGLGHARRQFADQYYNRINR